MNISINEITSDVENDTKTKEIMKNDIFEINEVFNNNNSSYTDISEFIQKNDSIGNSELTTNLIINANISNPNISNKKKFYNKKFQYEKMIVVTIFLVSLCMFLYFLYMSIYFNFPRNIEYILMMFLALFFLIFSLVIITDLFLDFDFQSYIINPFLVIGSLVIFTCLLKYHFEDSFGYYSTKNKLT